MPLINCTRCGFVFSRTNKSICPNCIQKEEAEFQTAVEWLRDNPGRNIDAMSESTGIDWRNILRWIREKRITMMHVSEAVRCKKCGAPIPSGNFCDRCKLELSQEVTEELKIVEKDRQAEGSDKPKGMHYNPSDRERRTRP